MNISWKIANTSFKEVLIDKMSVSLPEKLLVFWCLQGVQNGNIGLKWVKQDYWCQKINHTQYIMACCILGYD